MVGDDGGRYRRDVYKRQVLDEPTAMLDPSGRKEVIRAVRGLNQVEGVTPVSYTHLGPKEAFLQE